MQATRDLIRHWLIQAEQHRTKGNRTSDQRLDYMADILYRRYMQEPPETLATIATSHDHTPASALQAQQRALRRLRNPPVLDAIKRSGTCPASLWQALNT
jgi:hypothetical protein